MTKRVLLSRVLVILRDVILNESKDPYKLIRILSSRKAFSLCLVPLRTSRSPKN